MTDRDQCAFEEALRSDLNAARQEVMCLKDELRSANAANEALSYKVDFLTQEVGRVTASREQYERISIRVATFAESVVKVAMKQLQDLLDEIKLAAFTKVPGEVKPVPEASVAKIDQVAAEWIKEQPATISIATPGIATTPDMAALEQIGRNFGAGFSSADLLPPARFGNGAAK